MKKPQYLAATVSSNLHFTLYSSCADFCHLIRTVDALASGVVSYTAELLAAFSRVAEHSCGVYQQAFNNGQIPSGRLLELVLFPFLKLARILNNFKSSKANDQKETILLKIAMPFFSFWTAELHTALGFDGPPALQPSKRTELVSAIFAAKIPAVSSGKSRLGAGVGV